MWLILRVPPRLQNSLKWQVKKYFSNRWWQQQGCAQYPLLLPLQSCLFSTSLLRLTLSRCSCDNTFPHQTPAAGWLLTRMGREAVVLTGTRGDAYPQQLVSLTLFRRALHLSTTSKKCRLPHEEGWVRETAKSGKGVKKTFQKRKILDALWWQLPTKKPKQSSSLVCNVRLPLPAKDNGQS